MVNTGLNYTTMADPGDLTTGAAGDRVDLTSADDVEFKKKVYLILKSSLSGDEAAHKILALRVDDHSKDKVVDIVVKSSVQEPTYSKFYGLLLERLCSTHGSWKQGLQAVLLENYHSLNTFEPAQLRILGKLWGHIFASDYLGFELFQHFKMNEDDSTPPGRIFLKFLFQELVADLGIEELQERLAEEYIQPFLTNLFPQDDIDNIRYSINYFTSIGLGVLTKGMREQLQEMERELKKKQEATSPMNWKGHGPLPSQENKYADDSHKDHKVTKAPRKNTSIDDRRDRHRGQKKNNNRSRTPPRRSRTPPRRNQRSRTPPRGGQRLRTPPRSGQRSRTPPRRRNRSRSPKR